MDLNNSHSASIHSPAEPVDVKEPTTWTVLKSCSDTHWDKTVHALTLLSILWHQGDSPLFKGQLKA